MAGFRSLALASKIGGRALQRPPAIWPAVEVEHEVLIRRLPHAGLIGRLAHPPAARSRLFSSSGSETSEPLNKNCLNSRPRLSADAKSSLDSLGSNGLRQQVEKEELLHAAHKTPQPGSEDLRLTPTMKLLTFMVALIPVMTGLSLFRISSRPFSVEEDEIGG